MNDFVIEESLDLVLDRLYTKDRKMYERVLKKIEEITTSEDIEHYKNLRKPLQKFKRVQIGSFVLTFGFDKRTNYILRS